MAVVGNADPVADDMTAVVVENSSTEAIIGEMVDEWSCSARKRKNLEREI